MEQINFRPSGLLSEPKASNLVKQSRAGVRANQRDQVDVNQRLFRKAEDHGVDVSKISWFQLALLLADFILVLVAETLDRSGDSKKVLIAYM